VNFFFLTAIAVGALIGLVLGATGGGGSLLAIPLLVYGVGVEARAAAAMSLVVVAGAALVGVYQRRDSGTIKVRAALVFSTVGAIGAWAGAFGHRFVRTETVLLLFGLLMIAVVWRMLRRGVEPPESAPGESCAERFPRSCWIKVAAVGFLAGLLIGFFGVGGGFMIVPALTVVLGFPARMAVGTSLLIIALISVGGLLGHLQAGRVDWPLTALLLLGGALGMTGGSWVAYRLSPVILTKSFAAITLAVAIWLVLQNGVSVFRGVAGG
jgi:uncharacterized membrane protein YfcA